MNLARLLEAEQYLEDQSFIEEYSVNEALKSSILRNLLHSEPFRNFPDYDFINIPAENGRRYNWDALIDPEAEEKWRKNIGKLNRKSNGITIHDYMPQFQLDKVVDEDFERIDKKDARKKKYADCVIFWMDNRDQIVAISHDKHVFLVTAKRKKYTGEVEDFDMSSISRYDAMKHYKSDMKREKVISPKKGYGTTLNLVNNPEIEYCLALSYPKNDIWDLRRQRNSEKLGALALKTDQEVKSENAVRYSKERSKVLLNRQKRKIDSFVNELKGDKIPDFFQKSLDTLKSISDKSEIASICKDLETISDLIFKANNNLHNYMSYENDSYWQSNYDKFIKQTGGELESLDQHFKLINSIIKEE